MIGDRSWWLQATVCDPGLGFVRDPSLRLVRLGRRSLGLACLGSPKPLVTQAWGSRAWSPQAARDPGLRLAHLGRLRQCATQVWGLRA